MRITPDHISNPPLSHIFVFGSNLAGRHGKGAAKTALLWGAVQGVGEGLRGRTYAIPTKDRNIQTLPVEKIKMYVDTFIKVAAKTPDKIFMVTEIGCGLAGHSPQEIAPLFEAAVEIENIHLPQRFWDVLSE